MAGRPRSIDNTKVFDVAKPGKSRPMGTSRPVIVSHAAPIKDATVINVSGSNEEAAPLSAPSVTRRVIKPIDASATPAEETPKPASEKSTIEVVTETPPTAPIVVKTKELVVEPAADTSEAPVDEPVVAEEVPETPEVPTEETEAEAAPAPGTPPAEAKESQVDEGDKTEEETTEKTPEEAEEKERGDQVGSESASVDALAEASEKPKEDQKKAEEDAKKAAALQELIDSKKYVVPLAHDSSQQGGSNGAWIALLVLIILAAGAYALIDAKVIKTSINLPYHLFKQ
jgi:hypothetical protein